LKLLGAGALSGGAQRLDLLAVQFGIVCYEGNDALTQPYPKLDIVLVHYARS
jgi:hypothetical protein